MSDYGDFFIYIGAVLLLGVVIYFLSRRFWQNIFISEEEISKFKNLNKVQKQTIAALSLKKISAIISAIIIVVFLLNQFLMLRMNFSSILNKLSNINITITKK